MARRTGWIVSALLAMIGSSGCGLLCDRYCERHDRCRQDRCGCGPSTGFYPTPAPQNNCCPQPGVYNAQPAPYCP